MTRVVVADGSTHGAVEALERLGPGAAATVGPSYRGNFRLVVGPAFITALTSNGFRTMGSTVWGNVRPRVSVGVPETAEWNVCPLLVCGSGEFPRWDIKDVRDRAVPTGVVSRLVARAASLALILIPRLVGSISAGFLPVVSDLEAETAFLELAVLRRMLCLTPTGCPIR